MNIVVVIVAVLCLFGLCKGALVEDASYQVSVHLSFNDQFLCGGSIVSSNKILCPSSCLYYDWGGVMPSIIISVKAGGANFNDVASIYKATKVSFYEDYVEETSNLAIIEVEKSLSNSASIGLISLAKDILPDYENCWITGWNKETGDLIQSKVSLVECYENNTCATKDNIGDVCLYSLGSSLICDNILLGMLSESSCNDGLLFERVINVLNILEERNNSTSSSTSIIPVIKNKTVMLEIVSAIFIIFFIVLVI